MVLSDRTWLSLTPEPERELPDAIATLRAGGPPSADEVAAERRRAARLVERANRGAWTRWLGEVRRLAGSRSGGDRAVTEAARRATAVIDNHDALAQGITPRPRRRGTSKR